MSPTRTIQMEFTAQVASWIAVDRHSLSTSAQIIFDAIVAEEMAEMRRRCRLKWDEYKRGEE